MVKESVLSLFGVLVHHVSHDAEVRHVCSAFQSFSDKQVVFAVAMGKHNHEHAVNHLFLFVLLALRPVIKHVISEDGQQELFKKTIDLLLGSAC